MRPLFAGIHSAGGSTPFENIFVLALAIMRTPITRRRQKIELSDLVGGGYDRNHRLTPNTSASVTERPLYFGAIIKYQHRSMHHEPRCSRTSVAGA